MKTRRLRWRRFPFWIAFMSFSLSGCAAQKPRQTPNRSPLTQAPASFEAVATQKNDEIDVSAPLPSDIEPSDSSLDPPLARGHKAPEFGDGAPSHLNWSQLRGDVVLVNFWASWCEPCRAEFPKLQALYERLGESGLEIIGISLDQSQSMMQAFLKENPVSFPVFRDVGHSIVHRWSPSEMPTSFVVDQQGVVAYVHSGYQEERFSALVLQVENLLARSDRFSISPSSIQPPP